MLSEDGFIYKVIYSNDYKANLLSAMFKMQKAFPPLDLVINLQMEQTQPCTIRYHFLPYNPLNRMEAKRCLKKLLIGIANALNQLHRAGLSHNDVRLDNICFDANFRPVLIDLDRCHSIEEVHPNYTSSMESCMYSLIHPLKNGYQTDFFQLGWLVAWVLDSTTKNYHERSWQDLGIIQQNKFVTKLLMFGEFDSELLREMPDTPESVEEVLKSRADSDHFS